MKPLLLLVSAAAAAVAAPVPKDFRRGTDYSPMAVGDRREYVSPLQPDVVTQTREVTAVEERDGAKYYTQTISGNSTSVMRADKSGVYMTEQYGEKLETPYKIVGPTMKPGDTWKCNDPTGMTRTVGEPKKVETPAGTFTAYPVTCSYPEQPGRTSVVVWYAEGVGLVRLDSDGRTTLVLKKYTPGKGRR